jgi:hypothetical protein
VRLHRWLHRAGLLPLGGADVWGHGRGGTLLPERSIRAFFLHVSASHLPIASTSHSTSFRSSSASSTSVGDGRNTAGRDDGRGERGEAHVCLQWGDHLSEPLLQPHCNYLFVRKVCVCVGGGAVHVHALVPVLAYILRRREGTSSSCYCTRRSPNRMCAADN